MRQQMVLGCVLLAAAAGVRAAPMHAPPQPPLVIASLAGHDLYEFYCASCHGRNGKGDGPVAPALIAAPPDLTKLAIRSGNVFPRARVEAFITNDGDVLTTAHGTPEMPVWGPVFRGLGDSDALVRIRIANVVAYIESLQERPAE